MARQKLSEKKTEKLRNKTGLPIIAVLVRGGTDHRKDLLLEDGSICSLFKNGDIIKTDGKHF
jgi:hypothetical protein